MENIIIKIDDIRVEAKLNDSVTAQKIVKALPIKGSVNLWGDEIYFNIPVNVDIEDSYAKEVVELGDLGYWPQGSCFCIFFGPTPASQGDEIRPASAVNVIGQVIGDLEVFRRIGEQQQIEISRM